MDTPATEIPWYQFSLRSTLVFTACVAVLCSVGILTSWLFSAYLAAAALTGGVAGRLVVGARWPSSKEPFMEFSFSFLTAFGLLVPSLLWFDIWDLFIWANVVSWTAVFIGGVLGGVRAGFRRDLARDNSPET